MESSSRTFSARENIFDIQLDHMQATLEQDYNEMGGPRGCFGSVATFDVLCKLDATLCTLDQMRVNAKAIQALDMVEKIVRCFKTFGTFNLYHSEKTLCEHAQTFDPRIQKLEEKFKGEEFEEAGMPQGFAYFNYSKANDKIIFNANVENKKCQQALLKAQRLLAEFDLPNQKPINVSEDEWLVPISIYDFSAMASNPIEVYLPFEMLKDKKAGDSMILLHKEKVLVFQIRDHVIRSFAEQLK